VKKKSRRWEEKSSDIDALIFYIKFIHLKLNHNWSSYSHIFLFFGIAHFVKFEQYLCHFLLYLINSNLNFMKYVI
jgi:hypothetical protein